MEQHLKRAQSNGDQISSRALERKTCITPGTYNVIKVDGLLIVPRQREYMKTKYVTKEKEQDKIGYSQSKKVPAK